MSEIISFPLNRTNRNFWSAVDISVKTLSISAREFHCPWRRHSSHFLLCLLIYLMFHFHQRVDFGISISSRFCKTLTWTLRFRNESAVISFSNIIFKFYIDTYNDRRITVITETFVFILLKMQNHANSLRVVTKSHYRCYLINANTSFFLA